MERIEKALRERKAREMEGLGLAVQRNLDGVVGRCEIVVVLLEGRFVVWMKTEVVEFECRVDFMVWVDSVRVVKTAESNSVMRLQNCTAVA